MDLQAQVDLLKARIVLLEDAIRKHRDCKLDDRCWMDDYALYELLPEGPYVDLRHLPREEMLRNCRRYVDCRSVAETPERAEEMYREMKCLKSS